MDLERRSFLALPLLAAQAERAAAATETNKLGIDLFSIRDSKWTPFQYLDYCAKQGAQVVHFSEIRFLGPEGLQEDNLRKIRAYAEKLGIGIEIGMRSICPSSAQFDPKQGTAEEQLIKMAHSAKTIGSPIVRCFLGTFGDRSGPVGIEQHIANTTKVLRSAKSQLQDLGIKVAIENHAGDMQARELKILVEESGPEFVGVCLDSGNPLWAIEDPHLTLETLHPYVLTSHVRDTAVWRVPDGAAVQWVRMGDGTVGIDDYVRKYRKLCPGRPISLEIIVTGPRMYPYLKPEFWAPYRSTPAWQFSRFLALAEKGKPGPEAPKQTTPEQQRADLEASIAYTKKLLAEA